MQKDNTEGILDIVNFIKDRMVTKDEAALKEDLSALKCDLSGISDRLTSVESKIDGINRRLDTEAMARQDLSIPKRVSDVENELFGSSRHPRHIPL